MTERLISMTPQYYDTTDALADHLTDIAARLRTVGPVTRLWLSSLSIQVTSQGSAEPAQRIATIDAIAAALGLPPAETREVFGDSYHRRASDDIVTVYGVVPAPIEVQREQLLAQLAELDVQEAAQRATAQAALTPDSPELPAEPSQCYCANDSESCPNCNSHEHPVDDLDDGSPDEGADYGSDYIADPAARIADIAEIAPGFVAPVADGGELLDGGLIADAIATTQRIDDERLDEIVNSLTNTKRYAQRTIAADLPEFVAVIAVDAQSNPVEIELTGGIRIVRIEWYWSVKR